MPLLLSLPSLPRLACRIPTLPFNGPHGDGRLVSFTCALPAALLLDKRRLVGSSAVVVWPQKASSLPPAHPRRARFSRCVAVGSEQRAAVVVRCIHVLSPLPLLRLFSSLSCVSPSLYLVSPSSECVVRALVWLRRPSHQRSFARLSPSRRFSTSAAAPPRTTCASERLSLREKRAAAAVAVARRLHQRRRPQRR